MGSFVNYSLESSASLQMALAGMYESRAQTISKVTLARAQFAGNTDLSATDGSYAARETTTSASVPNSAYAHLASVQNTNGLFGKPLVIKLKKDEVTGGIKDYGVFNADGTWPGGFDPWNATLGTGARYRVNIANGEIYVNNATGLIEINDSWEGLINFPFGTYNTGGGFTTQEVIGASKNLLEGIDKVIGMVMFDTQSGSSLAVIQNQASEQGTVIQSLTSILKTSKDGVRSIMNVIK